MSEELIKRILIGIDKTQSESEEGWWETSDGASFGAGKLKELLFAITQQTEPVAWKFRKYDAAYDEVTEHFTDDMCVAKRHDQFPEPLYTAPQSGVREGMLRAAKICYNADKSTHPTDLGDVITRAADQVNTDTVSVPRDEVDTGAIAWAIKKLHAFGVAQNNQENAMMADRLEAMLRAAQEAK